MCDIISVRDIIRKGGGVRRCGRGRGAGWGTAFTTHTPLSASVFVIPLPEYPPPTPPPGEHVSGRHTSLGNGELSATCRKASPPSPRSAFGVQVTPQWGALHQRHGHHLQRTAVARNTTCLACAGVCSSSRRDPGRTCTTRTPLQGAWLPEADTYRSAASWRTCRSTCTACGPADPKCGRVKPN